MIRTCRVLLAPGFVNLSSGVNLAFDLPEPESPGRLKLEVRLWTFIGGSPHGNSELTHMYGWRVRDFSEIRKNLNQWRKALPSRERADKRPARQRPRQRYRRGNLGFCADAKRQRSFGLQWGH